MIPSWTTDAVTSDLSRAVHYTLLWGLEGVALQTVGGTGDRVPFVNEATLRSRLSEADLPVVAIAPGLFEGSADARAVWLNDLAVLEDAASFCQRIGCGAVRVGALGSDPDAFDMSVAADALRQAGAVAARHGLRLAVRNEAATAVATGEALADLLARIDHSAVGADWRPADALASGDDAASGVAAVLASGAPVVTVGARDGRVEGGWEETVLGEGGVGWDAQIDALAAAGVEAPLILDALPGPAGSHGLAAATALVRFARLGRRRRA